MTYARITQALSEARDDYAHATRALMAAESEAAQKRHARRAQTAANRIAYYRREIAAFTSELAA
jgi:hypothetical protein